jgi:hypothetical protein
MKFEMIFLTHDKQLHIRTSNHLYTQYLYDHLQKTELIYLLPFEVHKITTLTHCEQGHRHTLKEIISCKYNNYVKSVN